MKDPIVEEVRKARDEYARKFNYDIDLICDDLQKRQRLSGDRFVSLPKRPPIIIPTATNGQAESSSP